MKIIDVNCGLGKGKMLLPHRYNDVPGMCAWLDDNDICEAVVFHSEAVRDPETGNALILQECVASGGRLKPCFVTDPSLKSLGIPGVGSVADRLRAAHPAALRTFHNDQKYPFTVFFAGHILDAAQEIHLPVIISPPYKPLQSFFPTLVSVCEKYPEVPFVLLRTGFNRSRVIFPILEKLTNVYFDIGTMLDCGQLEEITERFGSRNLLFGSGLPTYEPSGVLGLLYYSCISQDDRENIAHRNWERLEGGICYDN